MLYVRCYFVHLYNIEVHSLRAGRGALFETNVLHRGNSMSGGNKYLLRTDIMVPRDMIYSVQQKNNMVVGAANEDEENYGGVQ